VIDTIPAGQVVSVERATFPGLIGAGHVVMGYPDDAYWLDVGTPAAYVRGSCDLVLGRLASPALPGPSGESLALAGAAVSPGATVTGGTVLGVGCQVGPGAEVTASVLHDGAVVGAGAQVTGSVIGAGAEVGPGAVLDGVVLGDRSTVGECNELRHGLRLWPGTRLGPLSVRFSTDA
jgi:mannose-1-phosphate guanylyltransferase